WVRASRRPISSWKRPERRAREKRSRERGASGTTTDMTIFLAIVILVAIQRVAELIVAKRNTRALLPQAPPEEGRSQYPGLGTLHALWLVTMIVVVPLDTPPDWYWLGLFIALQVLRVWVIASLGRFWTTRIITLPGAPLIRRGPYRVLRHPNYLVVALEI